MNNYFHRQIQLWGEKTQKQLRKKTVAIIGSGGLGSSISSALSGLGLKKIYLVDFDRVSESNIHRQIIFKRNDVDKYKSKVVKKYITSREKGVKVKAFTISFEEFAKKKRKDIDLIIDGTDNLHSRANIDKYAKSLGIPWIYGSVEDFSGQVCFFNKSNFDVFNIQKHNVRGIAAPFVMKIAATQANLAAMYLAGRNVKKDLLYFYSISKEGEEVIQKFKLPTS
ncbi:MAG: ThiF family adenylyltransferase [Campylobacterales bacterium]|nr:ThiF family adenylyltransferase [Campylobacterales bacterium]